MGKPENGDLDKLATKVEQVRAGVGAVAAALGITDGGNWTVRGVVVTRRPIPAGFVRSAPPFSFVTVEDVGDFAPDPSRSPLGA